MRNRFDIKCSIRTDIRHRRGMICMNFDTKLHAPAGRLKRNYIYIETSYSVTALSNNITINFNSDDRKLCTSYADIAHEESMRMFNKRSKKFHVFVTQ